MPSLCSPEAATGEPKLAASDITDKKGFSARWLFSVRTMDKLLRAGLPHMAVGRRRVRICVPEADQWTRERLGTQRRGLAAAKAATPEHV